MTQCGVGAVRSVDVVVHCVAPSLDAFEGLRVAATLHAAGAVGDGEMAVVVAAEPTRIKTDVWMAADTAGLPDRTSAGFGGSAKVSVLACQGAAPDRWHIRTRIVVSTGHTALTSQR